MPFHQDSEVEWMSVAMNMATSFAFWWVAGYFLGGDKYAPAIIGMTITGLRGAIAGTDAVGQLPDSLGVVSAKGWTSMPSYSRGGSTGQGGQDAAAAAVVSAIVTFIFWIVAGYFVISGSAWKYATTAAVIAGVGVAVSVLAGAFLVGTSVRASLEALPG